MEGGFGFWVLGSGFLVFGLLLNFLAAGFWLLVAGYCLLPDRMNIRSDEVAACSWPLALRSTQS